MGLTPALRRVFSLVEQAADKGQPCPTNEAIAAHMGIKSIGTASGYLSHLQRLGVIRLDRGQNARVVTIRATGRQTSGEPGPVHISRRRVAEHRQAPLILSAHREPCPRCGVRPDYGCRHSGARLVTGFAA